MYLQQFPSYSNRKCKKSPFSRTAAHIFISPWDAPAIITQYVAWIERQWGSVRTNVARAQHGEMRSINFHFRFLFWLRCFVDNVINFIYLCMKRNGLFSIDVSAVEGSMLAKRLAACTYLSSIVSELYRTMLKSMRKSKNRYFYHISACFPWERPWGNRAKCCMDGKRIRCLQIVSLHVPI